MEAIKHGWPVSVRAMSLEFPDDRTAWYEHFVIAWPSLLGKETLIVQT